MLAGLDRDDIDRLTQLKSFLDERSAYMRLQATSPRTIGYALTDSPVGQLAWIVEKVREWADASKVPEDAVDRDHLLTNVMIYWLTGTAQSAAELYFEIAGGPADRRAAARPHHRRYRCRWGWPSSPRFGVTRRTFADPGVPQHRAVERVRAWRHFAAMEEPDLLVDDIRQFRRRCWMKEGDRVLERCPRRRPRRRQRGRPATRGGHRRHEPARRDLRCRGAKRCAALGEPATVKQLPPP